MSLFFSKVLIYSMFWVSINVELDGHVFCNILYFIVQRLKILILYYLIFIFYLYNFIKSVCNFVQKL